MYNECNISYFFLCFSPQGHLSDNKWHTVIIGRPTRYSHTLMVDGHIATATTRGDNYHLDLDGILYLGNLSSLVFYIKNHIFHRFLSFIPPSKPKTNLNSWVAQNFAR